RTRRRGCCVTSRRSLLRGAGRCCTLAVLRITAFMVPSRQCCGNAGQLRVGPVCRATGAAARAYYGPNTMVMSPGLSPAATPTSARCSRALAAEYMNGRPAALRFKAPALVLAIDETHRPEGRDVEGADVLADVIVERGY